MDFVTTCKYIHSVPAACMAQFVEHLSGYKRFNKKHPKWVAVCVTFVHFLSKNIKGDNSREIIICACNDRGDLTHSSCYHAEILPITHNELLSTGFVVQELVVLAY